MNDVKATISTMANPFYVRQAGLICISSGVELENGIVDGPPQKITKKRNLMILTMNVTKKAIVFFFHENELSAFEIILSLTQEKNPLSQTLYLRARVFSGNLKINKMKLFSY